MHFPERLPPGALLGGYYRVTGFLGSGGMADVYEGQQTDTGARIAIKVLKPAANPDRQEVFNKRFLREAQIAASISHNHVVRIIAYRDQMALRLPDGQQATFARPFLVMERLEGRDLSEELALNGAMEPARAVRLLVGALDGLSEGHRQGVVHKDLKPSNLFLVHPGHARREKLVVLDFGVARLGQGSGEALTASGQIVTTAPYAAPEYLRDQIVTPALDVYQMGLVLAEMLAGEPVIKLDSAALTPEAYMMACALKHAAGVSVPAALQASPVGPILARALAREPQGRYPDAGAFCEALDALAIDASASPPRPEHSPKNAGVARKSSMWLTFLGVGALLGLLLLAGGAALLWSQHQRRVKPPEPDAELVEADAGEADAGEADAQALACADDQRAEGGACVPTLREGMALVPEGPFKMGAESDEEDTQDERPERRVSLDAFWIDVFEVSVGEYKVCVEARRCDAPVMTHQDHDAYNWGAPGRGSHPINGVTWEQARAYCAWKRKRLPTEAEWEKAARGVDGRSYPWGEEAADCRRAVLKWGGDGCGVGTTFAVDARPQGASPYGAQQMAGNVWEWVEDWYRPEGYHGLPTRNPRGPQSGTQRVLRGGSWYSTPDDMRAANRYGALPSIGRNHFGFRCARGAR